MSHGGHRSIIGFFASTKSSEEKSPSAPASWLITVACKLPWGQELLGPVFLSALFSLLLSLFLFYHLPITVAKGANPLYLAIYVWGRVDGEVFQTRARVNAYSSGWAPRLCAPGASAHFALCQMASGFVEMASSTYQSAQLTGRDLIGAPWRTTFRPDLLHMPCDIELKPSMVDRIPLLGTGRFPPGPPPPTHPHRPPPRIRPPPTLPDCRPRD